MEIEGGSLSQPQQRSRVWSPVVLLAALGAGFALVYAAVLLVTPRSWPGVVCELGQALRTTRPLLSRQGCYRAVALGDWQDELQGCPQQAASLPPDTLVCGGQYHQKWVWSSMACGQRRLGREQLSKLIANRTLSFAGDSHMRNLHNYLATMFGGITVIKGDQPELHSQLLEGLGCNLTFSWSPYIRDTKKLLRHWEKVGFSPDLLVVDGAVWHLAHDKNLVVMAAEAEQLLGLVERARKTVFSQTLLVWVYGPPFHPALQANRSDVAFEWINVYNKVVGKAGLLAPEGPFHLVDLYSLAQGCLHWCMLTDMAHAGPLVNEVALQWILNMLLLQQEQQREADAGEGSTNSWGGRGSSDPGFENK